MPHTFANQDLTYLQMHRNTKKGKGDVWTLAQETVLSMSTEKALVYVDLRDTMKKQFAPQEIDFLFYQYDLKVIEIRLLDRIYLQTSAQPYYEMRHRNSQGKQNPTNGEIKSPEMHLDKSIQGPRHSHKKSKFTKMTKDITPHTFLEKKIDKDSLLNHHISNYDVVFGDRDSDDNQVYFVYKKSQSHVIDDNHTLVTEKLKTKSLVTCLPEPGNRLVINVNKKWFRALITERSPRTKGCVVVKLVDLGRYVEMAKISIHSYKIPSEINEKPLAFKMKVTGDKTFDPGCIASVEQLNDDKKPVEARVISILKVQNILSISCNVSITLNSPMTVLVLSKEGEFHWVQDMNFTNIYAVWHKILESNIVDLEQSPKVGDYCLKNYDFVWCRAVVTNQEPLKIFYIDYGNEEVVTNLKDLKQIPGMCLIHEPFAFKVKWVKEENMNIQCSYEDEVKIIPVEVLDKNTFKVLKEDELSSRDDWTYGDKPINCFSMNMAMNKLQEFHILDKTLEFLVGTLSNYNIDVYNNLSIQAAADKTHDISYDDIQQGDYVLVLDKNSKQWCRAQLVDQECSTFYLLDYGRYSDSPNHIKSLLNKMWDIPPRLMKIKINISLMNLCLVDDVVEIIPLHITNDNIVTCELVSTPLFALESPPPLTLNKECTAYFTNVDSVDKTISYFFLNLDNVSSSLIHFHSLMENSKKLIEVNVGDYCGILQEASMFYRAKVLRVSGNKVIVFILDLGEIDIVNDKECYELPFELYSLPPLISKTKPLDLSLNLETKQVVTLIPRKEITKRFYSVNIVIK